MFAHFQFVHCLASRCLRYLLPMICVIQPDVLTAQDKSIPNSFGDEFTVLSTTFGAEFPVPVLNGARIGSKSLTQAFGTVGVDTVGAGTFSRVVCIGCPSAN